MSAALLAKLTAQGVDLGGEGFGGVGALTAGDVAGAMAGMRRESYQLLRLKYCGDESMLAPVVQGVTFRLLGEAMTNEGDVLVSAIQRMAELIVYQATEGPVCKTCNGTGVEITQTAASDCRACRGSGRRPMPQGQCAEYMQVSRNTYTKRYDALVSRYVNELGSMESEGIAHLRRKIRDRKNHE